MENFRTYIVAGADGKFSIRNKSVPLSGRNWTVNFAPLVGTISPAADFRISIVELNFVFKEASGS